MGVSGSSVTYSAPPLTRRLYCFPVSAEHIFRMSCKMVSGASPVHTSDSRVGSLGISPTGIPALAHIRRMASSAAALDTCSRILLLVRYHPLSLAVTLPSSPTVWTTPEKTSLPWLSTRSLLPGRTPGHGMPAS